ncbi:MAG: SRPBCC family protein [Burkholderiaceae bacterium]|nr:SRPBCC family protein [Burkholderiaceae bacterium]
MHKNANHPPLCQIAFSVVDLRRTESWFREGLGFLPAGGSRFMMSTPLARKIQGLPGAASCCWWLVGRNPWFQIEMFQFRRPIAKLMPQDFRPCDIGYTRIGVYVADFDAALARLASLGSMPLAAPIGQPGQRRACLRNPDGVYVEVMEDDPIGKQAGERDCRAAMRSVTMSTPDFEASVAYLTAINGHGPESTALHGDEHEALWGLPGARCKRAVFRSGDVLVEVVQYLDPIGQPWPAGYRVSDQGILNIAYGARNKVNHTTMYQRASTFGARPNWRPFHVPGSGVVYVNDALGFSVELLWMGNPKANREWGFEPLPLEQRPVPDNQTLVATTRIAAPLATVWQVLNEQERMNEWIGFKTVRITRGGHPERDGVGSERTMEGSTGTVVEQIIGIEPQRAIRYRVIEGAPFNFHRGEVSLRAVGKETEVSWRISFRGKLPLVGALLRVALQPMLTKMLTTGLKSYVERIVISRCC